MKTCYLLVALMTVYCNEAIGATITAIQNGNWNNNSTWDLNRIPTDNDEVIIPTGRTVYLRNTPYPKSQPASRPTLKIKVYGEFDFSDAGTDKLYLDEGSVINIFEDGKISTSNNSNEIIAIYGGTSDNNVWDGEPSSLDGPLYATDNSSGFMNGLLPLRFVAFDVMMLGTEALLQWTTADEYNTSHFVIETSTGENQHWKKVGEVKAAGYATGILKYSYVVTNLENGKNYFRLKQVDIDEAFNYSAVKGIINSKAFDASVRYNPNDRTLYINNAEGSIVTVNDVSGAKLASLKVTSSRQLLLLNSVRRGSYIVSVLKNTVVIAVTRFFCY